MSETSATDLDVLRARDLIRKGYVLTGAMVDGLLNRIAADRARITELEATFADALEEAAKVATYGKERVRRDWRNPDKAEGAEGMAAEIEEAIRALIDDTGPSIADELAQARGFIKDYQRQLSEEMVRSSVAEAKLAKVQGALDDLAIRLGDPQRRYNKIGPTWTSKSGHEYSDMSELLDFATEIGEQTAAIRALIDREPAPVRARWKLVPMEADTAMVEAAADAWGNARDIWRAMYDAAPTPPEPAPEKET